MYWSVIQNDMFRSVSSIKPLPVAEVCQVGNVFVRNSRILGTVDQWQAHLVRHSHSEMKFVNQVIKS